MKNDTIKGAEVAQRAWALLLAVALCLGLVPGIAWAAEGTKSSGGADAAKTSQTATLTIVQGVGWNGPVSLVNKSYEFTGKATVADLFEAAKAAGDIKGYAFNDYGYLDSVTTADGAEIRTPADWSVSWSIYKNGAAAGYDQAKPDEGKDVDLLADGDAFQFAWCDSVANAAPTADQWKALADKTEAGDGVAGDQGKAQAGSATITLVKGIAWDGPAALLNKTYTFNEGATVADLFEAAKAAGDIKGYAFNDYGYLDSVTTADGAEIRTPADWSASWSIYKNGEAAGYDQAKPDEGKDVDALADSDAFQFAWCDSVPNVAPTAEQWKALSAAAVKGDATAEGEVAVNPTPSSSKVDVATLDGSLSTVYRTLFANLALTLEGSGGASERNISSWKAMEAAAIGQAGLADVDAAIAEAVTAYNQPQGNSLQRCIIVLTALGVDATKVPSSQGTLNLVEKLANDESAVTAYPTSVAFALLAYACGPYEVSADATNSARALIDKLSAAQSPAGGYLIPGGALDVDTTAMVVPALAAYQGDATAKAALDKAVAALCGAQQDDGTFGNLNSTAMAVVALCSVGIDPASEEEWTGSAAPLKALLSFAKEDMTGFSVATGMEEDMVNEQGFRALVAYQGLKNTGAAYNVYVQAKLGQAVLPAEKQETAVPPVKQENGDRGGDAPVVDKKALAKTGDGSLPFAASVAAIGALATGVLATRRLHADGKTLVRR